MNVIICNDYNEMSEKAAEVIADVMKAKKDCILGLATGSTPVGMYKQLIEKYNEGKIDFSGVTTINLDEYYPMAPDNDQSYRYFMNENLFNHVNVDKAKTFVPSHAEVSNDISELIELNFQKTREIIDMVRNILTTDYMSTDDVIFEVFRRYEMEMNITQYALAGSTIHSIISYLTRKGELGIYTTDYKLRFKKY